jgi:hypothetical protein
VDVAGNFDPTSGEADVNAPSPADLIPVIWLVRAELTADVREF